MGDLEVATEELMDLGKKVKDLGSDLKEGDGHADYGLYDLAHHKVVDAMDNFRGNWDDNRDHLAEKLDQLGEMAKTAAKSFTDADADLAKKLREAMEKGS